jgi:DHA1 family tetracycline resistance protein-like MFS transporter
VPRALIPVLLAVFLDLVGFGIVIPLLTFYAETFDASPMQVTLLMACYSLAQFLFAPVWGAVSDRFGRRPVMLFSIAATALGLAGFAASTALWQLFLFRTLHGMATANISTAQACVADLTPPEKRAMGMGLIGAAFGVGFTVGPWVGGELSAWGFATPIWFAAGLSALNFVLALAMLPETRPATTGPAFRTRSIRPGAFFEVLQHPVVGLCVLLTFVLTSAFGMMESTFTLFAEHVRELTAAHVGRMFGVAGVVMILIQGGLIGRLVKRFGEEKLLPVGLVIMAIGLALLPLAPPTVPMVLVFCLMAIGQGVSNPSLQSLISRGTSEHEQGFVLGTNQSLSALARVAGPVAGGALYASVGPAAPFFVGAVVVALSVGLSVVAIRRRSAALANS